MAPPRRYVQVDYVSKKTQFKQRDINGRYLKGPSKGPKTLLRMGDLEALLREAVLEIGSVHEPYVGLRGRIQLVLDELDQRRQNSHT